MSTTDHKTATNYLRNKLLEISTATNSLNPDPRLQESLQYALTGPGKLVRGTMSLLFCEAFGASKNHALTAALAIEWVHLYSLIHDDLPCMDNDDFRRGRPTLHRAFDEAHAVLTGDALLTDAFAILSGAMFNDYTFVHELLRPEQQLSLIRELSLAAGSCGMIAGQSLDMASSRGKNHKNGSNTMQIHALKTGKLISAACKMGAVCANANLADLERASNFGMKLGIAYQIYDDLLDTQAGTGKSIGKDQDQGKLTVLSSMSVQEARSTANQLIADSLGSFQSENESAIVEFSRTLIDRFR